MKVSREHSHQSGSLGRAHDYKDCTTHAPASSSAATTYSQTVNHLQTSTLGPSNGISSPNILEDINTMEEIESLSKSRPVTWLSLPQKPQLLILAMCRLSEPLSNTCLLPYLYYLMRSLQSPSSSSASTSRQAGLVVAIFAFAQFATSMPWAKFADRRGRKEVIVIGLVGSIISNIGFGFARSLPTLMFWRLVAGIANGNIGVMRTMTAEIVKEKKYQSRAFLLLPLVFNAGNTIGLAMGGLLADPVTHLPTFFGPQGSLNLTHDPEGVAWMRRYPFALPTLVNATALSVSLLFAIGGLKETLPSLSGKKDRGILLANHVTRFMKRMLSRSWRSGYAIAHSGDCVDIDICEKPNELLLREWRGPAVAQAAALSAMLHPPSIWTRDVLYTLFSFALLPLHNAAFMQVFPLFLSTPQIDNGDASLLFFNGGLGLPSATIGLWLSFFGVLGIMVQLLVYPRLQAYRGTLWAYRLALSSFPLAYVMAPYLSQFSGYGWKRWLGIWLILFLQVTARTFAIPSSVILLTNVASSRKDLGTIHGAGNMVSSLSRAVGPAVAGFLFGWGMEVGMVGLVWWVYLTLVAGIGIWWSFRLKEGRGPT
ncbi:hypothetical protein MMC19_000510 [Ptychographa xylographoides]|nr:hypothetical protein [Ptychographa xylographoides]